MKTKFNFSVYVAEFIGSFFMLFFGCGSMVLAEMDSHFMGAFVPLIWGGAVSIMIYAVGHISGAHFNPAVTIAFWSTGKFSGKRVLGYILSQLSGGLLASLILLIIWGDDHQFGMTEVKLPVMSGFMLEAIMSFALMFVITSVATDSRAVGELAGVAIGSTIALCAFVGGPLTGASMNPARSIAPALFAGHFNGLWLYILAPIVGAVLGAKVYIGIKGQGYSND